MKQRLLTGWTFIRILYLLMGIGIIIQSLAERQWMGLALGVYFAFMGLFAVGCAAGNCQYSYDPKNRSTVAETEFEEIK